MTQPALRLGTLTEDLNKPSLASEERQHSEAEKPPPSPALAPVRRLEYIDGLRAAAALWVLLHHAIETSEPSVALHLPIVGPALASLFFGQFPVMVFLMLSGFCLFYPCVRKNVAEPRLKMSFGAYLLRRAKRIVPPYYAAGALCLILFLFPALQVGRWQIVGPVDVNVILSHLLLVHNLIPSHATKIDYPMWSIGLEWQLYLVFPLLIWAFRRSNGPIVIAATLAIAALVRGTYHLLPTEPAALLHDGPFSYLEIFATGMFAASLTVEGRRLLPPWALACIAIGGFGVLRLGSGNGLVHDLATSAAAFSILLLAIDPKSGVSRFLSTPWLVRIGIFSYSLYLVHAPILHLIWFCLRPLQLSPDATFLVLVLSVPLVVGLAYGFHRVFERPFMRVT
jgi:peptidoglycan/LPS O-acetylase OafA/YrhL